MPNKDNADNYEIATLQPKQGVWRTYDVTDGLPMGISRLLQDGKGYLWLSGSRLSGGLFRYDGASFITYTTTDGLADTRVRAICEDCQGRLWFGTECGVSCFDGQRFTTFTTTDGLADNRIRAICEDCQGRLWFGTECGVSCFDGQRFATYTTDDGLADNNVGAILENHQGHLWFGTECGVSCFDGQRFATYTTDDGLAGNNVIAILEDCQGRLWFGTERSGVCCFDGQQFTTYTTDDGLVNNWIGAICEDYRGRLWFGGGVSGGGVSCFDGHCFITYTAEDGLLDNRVLHVIQDRERQLWFAHVFSGLTRFDVESSQRLTVEPITEILLQDRQGRLWFGNENVLCCLFEGQQRRQVFNTFFRSLLIDSSGALWVGTSGDGLYYYDSADAVWGGVGGAQRHPEHWGRQFTTTDGLGSNCVESLLEARDGTIWLGTWGTPGCLCRFNGKTFQAIPTPHPVIFRLFEDCHGRIWMGGWQGGGLSCYDAGAQDSVPLQTYTIEDGLPDNRVQSIVEDDEGNLWIGTYQGVCCFDGKRFTTYAAAQGLFSLKHGWAAKDTTGKLWFGTLGGGLYCYDGKHFQWLTEEDGLPSNSIMGLLPQPDGSMIIGTYRGMVHYRPTTTIPPRIEIREVVANQVYRNPVALELTDTETDLLTISYYGLSFATQRMRYSYIMEGYDHQWQDTWEDQVRYENLKEGEYLFKVIAINRDLVPSEEPATLKLTVVPDPRDQQIAQLESELARRNRELEAELQDAHNVQMSLMPEIPPPIEGVEIAGKCVPANTVSGDFFDYLEGKEQNEIALVVADVCGKAMKGAMNAVMAAGVLRMAAEKVEQLSPGSLMSDLNNVLKDKMEWGMNITMVIGKIDTNTQNLTLSNAAHHAHPLLLRNDEVQALKTGGMPLGMMAGIQYTEEKFLLQSGDVLILMTDGIIEAKDSDGNDYSESGRLEETISSFTPGMSAEAMVDAVINDAIDYSADKSQRDDDMTVVVAKMQ